jgi:regulator of replication initiation timing
MEFKNTLNKIKALLSIEIKLEQMTLVDGITVLEAESFEPDYSVGIVTSEGIVPAPIGEHETTDGMIVVVEVEGIIKEVKPVATAEEEVEVEVEAAAETPAVKKVVDTITKETFFAEVKVEVEKIEAENKALKVELEALKLELAEAGAKAIVTNPEPAVKREMTALEKFRVIKQNLK